jgi:hypothetical protein
MSDRRGGTPPLHGPGPFDDPFMFPESSPKGDGPPQRRQGLIILAILGIALIVLLVLLSRG